ncbi:MAG TPA: hypothetical protein PKA00_18645 [Saprospiraceae bacterium]|nr:hypothetical protein [Saprospiraceae bacterium]HMQ84939.1 hypothetical protein [Saprospiraceae bacterium]
MKVSKPLFLLLMLLIANSAFAQLTLKKREGGREITLKPEGEITLTMDASAPGITEGTRRLQGTYLGYEDHKVRLLPDYEYRHLLLDNGLHKDDRTAYKKLKGLQPMSIASSELIGLNYQGKGAIKIHKLGKWLTAIGALSTLFAAPLVSIENNGKSFNINRYYRWSAYSLGVTGVGITLGVSSKKKAYYFKQPKFDPNADLWIIKP